MSKMLMLIFQVAIVTANLIANVDSSKLTLAEACGQHDLIYGFESPIDISNDQSAWSPASNQSDTQKKCHLVLNGTVNSFAKNSTINFVIRVNLKNKNASSSMSYLSIVDHDSNHQTMANSMILNETAVAENFATSNFIRVESTCFEMSLVDKSQAASSLFDDISSITITSFTNTINNECKSTEFKCSSSNICIDINFRCDGVASCGDSSDEQFCTSPTAPTTKDPALSNSNSSLTTTLEVDTNNSTSNGTDVNTPVKHEYKYMVALLLVFVFFVGLILAGWVYGRRKRKWREFLAQLDNNTDWEYEQLEDNHYPMGSRAGSLPNMSPMINMKITNDAPSSRQQSNGSTLTERTPIT